MSQPPAMTVDVRQSLVRQLIEQDPTLSARKIAGQIGVGKDTVRRDLEAIRREDAAAAPQPAPSEPEPAPDDDRLVLVLDEPLRQALAVLRASRARPDTHRENVAAARAAIRAMADTITEQTRP
ncbi:HTH domain-containing protein [Streptomyces sp. BB1-1-1]|uniref:HTH domain-containing protein n=1 Tax=Streptomyces sp. BB1-1-1 TaxID=3074430 RepID=UPI002877F956|nr:HTH domain-containing protein [Streptomyces sp. BB1-1-1]WND33981.1 HTH domain-containing protein [Streptomyces sp. BB1-1-1]